MYQRLVSLLLSYITTLLTHVLGQPSRRSFNHIELSHIAPGANAGTSTKHHNKPISHHNCQIKVIGLELILVVDRAQLYSSAPYLANLMAMRQGFLAGLPLGVKRLLGSVAVAISQAKSSPTLLPMRLTAGRAPRLILTPFRLSCIGLVPRPCTPTDVRFGNVRLRHLGG